MLRNSAEPLAEESCLRTELGSWLARAEARARPDRRAEGAAVTEEPWTAEPAAEGAMVEVIMGCSPEEAEPMGCSAAPVEVATARVEKRAATRGALNCIVAGWERLEVGSDRGMY